MGQETTQEDTLRRYLLGEMDEEEMTAVQDRVLTDQDFYELLLSVENELTDEYVRMESNSQDQARFINYFFATPERQRKRRFAKVLHIHISSPHSSTTTPSIEEKVSPVRWWQAVISLGFQRPALALSMTGILLLILAGTTWLVIENAKLRNQLEEVQSLRARQRELETRLEQIASLEQQQASEDQLSKQRKAEEARALLEKGLDNPKQSPTNQRKGSRAIIVSFLIIPGLTRDDVKSTTLEVPQSAEILELQLSLDVEGHQVFRAELRTAEGRDVWERGNLRIRRIKANKVVVARLPVKLLQNGDYILILRGLTSGREYDRVGTYSFRIVKT